MEINPQLLVGNWSEGYALDIHTLSSVPAEYSYKTILDWEWVDGVFTQVEKKVQDLVTKWDTQYSPIGFEMNHLKYWKEKERAQTIAIQIAKFLKDAVPYWAIDIILPVPPSDHSRVFQPVFEIAYEIGRILELPVDNSSIIKTVPTGPLKEIEDPILRREILQNAFTINTGKLVGRNVLLFDDLYRSGETLKALTNVIMMVGNANSVYVLTVTKTRSKR